MTRSYPGARSGALLVAGIGNVFNGDGGFGVEVARRLRRRPLPEGVDVTDFGIRSTDLMYALGADYRTVVLVEAAARGLVPGTVSLVEPVGGLGDAGHPLDPVRLAREDGRVPARTLLVACEPAERAAHPPWEMTLSRPVAAAVAEAVRLVEMLVVRETGRLLAGTPA
ncbi:hydrogenase maturation protease [Actinomadura sp. 7K534]|uniref:hydrogenase maturation protease n=1 Tax=Actinomadura sp. 7K534 TaxID=2530366 RepID=UPI001FB7C5DD|nr:hydrogenase maturation protease [Actinomadura sp. 7K534]